VVWPHIFLSCLCQFCYIWCNSYLQTTFVDFSLQSHRYVSHIVERNAGNVTTKNLHLLMRLQLGDVDGAAYRNHKEYRREQRWEGILVGALLVKIRETRVSELQKELVRVWGLVCAQAHQNNSVFFRDCWNPSPTHVLALACEKATMHTCSHTFWNLGPNIMLHH